jgi:hypothetical protein
MPTHETMCTNERLLARSPVLSRMAGMAMASNGALHQLLPFPATQVRLWQAYVAIGVSALDKKVRDEEVVPLWEVREHIGQCHPDGAVCPSLGALVCALEAVGASLINFALS